MNVGKEMSNLDLSLVPNQMNQTCNESPRNRILSLALRVDERYIFDLAIDKDFTMNY